MVVARSRTPDNRYRTSMPRRDPRAPTSAGLGSLPSGYLRYGPLAPTRPPMAGPVLVQGPKRQAGTVRMEQPPAAVAFAHRQTAIPTTVRRWFCCSSFTPVVRRFFGASHYRGGIGTL